MTERGLVESDTLISGHMSHEQIVETVFVDNGDDKTCYTQGRACSMCNTHNCNICESNL